MQIKKSIIIKSLIITHWPTIDIHPIIQLSSHACDFIVAPLKMVHLLMHAPSSIVTSGPMVTFGPILQFLPIFADGSTRTLPTIPEIEFNE